MFSTFDIIILVLASISWLFAYASLEDPLEEKLTIKKCIVLLTACILCFALSMHWFRNMYFDSIHIYWFCVIGVAITGPMGLSIIGSIVEVGIVSSLNAENKIQTMSLSSTITAHVLSCILLGSTIYEFPHILAQTEIEYTEKQMQIAKEKELKEEKDKELHDAWMYEAICAAKDVMRTIPSEQSYKYKRKKLQECQNNIDWAYMNASDSIIKGLIKDASQDVDNGIHLFYANIYNWAKMDKAVIVDTLLLKFNVKFGHFDEISIKTDGSYEANQKLIEYLDGINIYIDSALVCLENCDLEYQKIKQQREFIREEEERLLQEQRQEEQSFREREEAIADSIRHEQEMQEFYKKVGGKEKYDKFMQDMRERDSTSQRLNREFQRMTDSLINSLQ